MANLFVTTFKYSMKEWFVERFVISLRAVCMVVEKEILHFVQDDS